MTYDKRILTYLQTGKAITPAFIYRRIGCLALHSAINRLREAGHKIDCQMQYRGSKKWGKYTMGAKHG